MKLLSFFLFAGILMFSPSCKKCKTCTLTKVSHCAKCTVSGIDGPEFCEATSKTQYDNFKSLCSAANGDWNITSTDSTRLSEDICANNKADVVDKSIDYRLNGYTCVDK